jgi:hypothetical protein
LERSDILDEVKAARPVLAERPDARQKSFGKKKDRISGLERSDINQ